MVLVFVGIGVFVLLLWEPQIEGRNRDATFCQIYFNDPFLAYAYITSIAFFVALYQAFKLLGYTGRNEIFSQQALKALQTIKYCAITLVVFIVGAEGYLFIFQCGNDDIAGGVAVGLFLIFVSIVIAAAATIFEDILKSNSQR